MPKISLRLPIWGIALWLTLWIAGCTSTPAEPPAQVTTPTPGTTAVPPEAYPPPATVEAPEFTGYPIEPEGPATPTSSFTAVPKPTLTPTLIPSITPSPTPLALIASDYLAVWADVAPRDGPLPEDPDTIFWIADPADIGNRQELFRFSDPTIVALALSPDGRYIALSTRNDGLSPGPLWLFDRHNQTLAQLIPDSSHLFAWTPDSKAIVSVIWQGEGFYLAIEMVNIESGERSILVTTQETDSHPDLSILGWSADGGRLYYQKASPVPEYDNDYEVWRLDLTGEPSSPIQLIPSGYKPLRRTGIEPETETILLNPRARISYYRLAETTSLVSTAELNEALTQNPIYWRNFTGVWSPTTPELIYTNWDQTSPTGGQVIWRHNLLTQATEEIGVLNNFSNWDFHKISPDLQWLALRSYENDPEINGPHILHLPTDKLIPVSHTQGHRYEFLGWVAKPGQ